MVDPSLPALSDWANFYVITGSGAAALTGLMFVVIALQNDIIGEADERTVRAFATPNVLHFCGALLIAAILTVPHHTVKSLEVCIAATGFAGLALSTWVMVQARRQRSYTPVLSDWIWHVALPLVGYFAVVAAADVLPRSPPVALDMIAASSLLLVFVGIHNAWDSAVWIARKKR